MDGEYYDSNGEKRSLAQMIRIEPYWAANRLREGEKAIEKLAKARLLLAEAQRQFRGYGTDMEYMQKLTAFLDEGDEGDEK